MAWTKTAADRKRDAAVYGPAWRKARAAALAKANYRCELRYDGCTRKATQVDHTLGADNDPHHQNLRAACATCHRQVTAQQGGGWRNPPQAPDPSPRPATTW